MQFALLIYESPAAFAARNNDENDPYLGAWRAYHKALVIPAVILLLLVPFCLAADKKEERPKPAQSIDELRQQIEKILKDTHTNGVSVAIVHKDGPEWVTGLGIADLASNRPATADTLFRIGSTSKAFVSL